MSHLEYGLEETKVAEPPGLIVKLLPLGILGDRDEDVGGGLLQELEQGEVSGLSPQILLDSVQRRLTVAPEGHNNTIRKEAVNPDLDITCQNITGGNDDMMKY